MKRVFRAKPCIFGFAVMALCCRAEQVGYTYYVSEIVSISSPVSFECRLKDFPDSGQARFRVFLRGVSPAAESPRSDGVLALENLLRSAKTIELRDIKTRNYFRLEASVFADSKNVADLLVSGKFVEAQAEKAVSAASATSAPTQPFAKMIMPAAREVPAPVRYPPHNLQQLVLTRADFSLLRSETPFAEALQIIGDSVEPRLPMVVFWNDLENNAFVEKDTPIGVEGFSTLSTAMVLDCILYSLSGYGEPLKFTIDQGILKIGTVRSLSKKSTQVYSVVDLISPPAYYSGEDGYRSGNTGSGNMDSYSGAR